jgi:nucleotide-binding universal stress UspA family protein
VSVTLHPLGIGLAVVFTVSLLLMFRWMFRVPPQVPKEVAAVCHSVAAMERILVPVSGKLTAERAVELACRLGAAQKAEIILVYVIEVPLTLSLSSSVPQEEARGKEALQTARLIVQQHGLPAEVRLIPHRQAAAGIVQLAQQEVVDAIVMAAGQEHPGLRDSTGRTAGEVLRRAPCEVIVDRVPC